MSTSVVYLQGRKSVTVPAGGSIAVASVNTTIVSREVGYPNEPSKLSILGQVNQATGQTVFGPYTSGAIIVLEAGAAMVGYEVGTDPIVNTPPFANRYMPAPGALNATGTITPALILGTVITSTTAAAVAATLPTGAVLAAASTFAIGDWFDWSVIATGANAFTLQPAGNHTIIGNAAVATLTSGRFLTRMSAAGTFVTYRVG